MGGLTPCDCHTCYRGLATSSRPGPRVCLARVCPGSLVVIFAVTLRRWLPVTLHPIYGCLRPWGTPARVPRLLCMSRLVAFSVASHCPMEKGGCRECLLVAGLTSLLAPELTQILPPGRVADTTMSAGSRRSNEAPLVTVGSSPFHARRHVGRSHRPLGTAPCRAMNAQQTLNE